jgi:hypothetical protein
MLLMVLLGFNFLIVVKRFLPRSLSFFFLIINNLLNQYYQNTTSDP